MLKGVEGVRTLAVRSDRDCVWGQYTVFVERRAEVQAVLQAAGVPTAVHYPKPLHHQPAYRQPGEAEAFPKSVAAGDTVLSLPMSADLTEPDQARVVVQLKQALRGHAVVHGSGRAEGREEAPTHA